MKAKPGYKLVKFLFGKFEEIPENWEQVRLIEKCSKKPEYGAGESAIEKNMKFPRYIRITDLNDDGSLRDDEWKSITPESAKGYLLNDGDVIFARTGATVGKSYLYNKKDGECAFAGYLIRFVPDQTKLDSKFLFYISNSSNYWKWLTSIQTQGVQPNVNAQQYSNLPLFLPPIPEQQKITAILSNVDELILFYDNSIESNQKLKKGLIQTLLTRGIGHKKFKNVKLRFGNKIEIPEEWEYLKIKYLLERDDILEIQDGNHGELHPKSSDFIEQGIPFITADCLIENKIDYKKCHLLPQKFLKILRIGFAKTNDVLLSHKASIGNTAIVGNTHSEIILSPQTTYYRLSKKISSYFLYYIFQSSDFQKQLRSLGKQSTRDYIGITNQQQLIIPYTILKEQQKITSILSHVDNKIDELKSKKSNLEKLQKGLMQTLLTGQIGVKITT
jgi:type I restriction enzyme, S subunit